MRIWHRGFTDLTVMPLYRKTLAEHASAVMGNDAAVTVHGLRPGTYAEGCAPIDAIKYRYVASINELQVCDAALVAEREAFRRCGTRVLLRPRFTGCAVARRHPDCRTWRDVRACRLLIGAEVRSRHAPEDFIRRLHRHDACLWARAPVRRGGLGRSADRRVRARGE